MKVRNPDGAHITKALALAPASKYPLNFVRTCQAVLFKDKHLQEDFAKFTVRCLLLEFIFKCCCT